MGYTKKQIALKIEEIRKLISQDITPFLRETPAQQVARKKQARSDFDYFCRTYLPNFFTSPPAKFHKEIDKEIGKNTGEIIVLCAPREHGKTIRWGIAYELYAIVTKKRRFIVNVCETESLAIDINLNVRVHLESNLRIKHDYGDLRNAGTWSEEEFVTTNGVKVLARGYKQPVRGLLFGAYRPDYINIQDLSSLQSSRNAILERQKLEWVLGECFGSLGSEGKREKGTVFWAGNYLRKSSAIAQCEKEAIKPERGIFFRKYAAVDFVTGWVLWSERYDVKYFEHKQKKVGSLIFAREWQQEDSSGGRYYSEDMFNTFSIADTFDYWQEMTKKLIYIDPAYGTKKPSARSKGSDLKVALVMGYNQQGFFLFDTYAGQMSLQTFGDGVCELQKKWHATQILYEGNFSQKDIIGHFLEEASKRKAITLPYKAYYTYTNKDDRIQYGNPLAEQGKLWYCNDIAQNQAVIDDLVMYPDVTYKDRCDAFGTALEILEKGFGTKIKAKIWRR